MDKSSNISNTTKLIYDNLCFKVSATKKVSKYKKQTNKISKQKRFKLNKRKNMIAHYKSQISFLIGGLVMASTYITFASKASQSNTNNKYSFKDLSPCHINQETSEAIKQTSSSSKPSSSKLLLYVDTPHLLNSPQSLLVAIKKVRRKKRQEDPRDGKFEFIGGKIDSFESPWEALLRETLEEDKSGTVTGILKNLYKKSPDHIHQIHINLHHKESVALFMACVNYEAIKYVIGMARAKEVYGFKLIPQPKLSQKMSEEEKINWTPKSAKILHKLRKKIL